MVERRFPNSPLLFLHPQKFQRAFKIFRERSGETQLLFRARMNERQLVRVQQNTRGFIARQFRELLRLTQTVSRITRDGTAPSRHFLAGGLPMDL